MAKRRYLIVGPLPSIKTKREESSLAMAKRAIDEMQRAPIRSSR